MNSSAASRTFGRKLGYSIGAAVNGVMLYLVNVSPGWEAVPFLTRETAEIIPLVNFSLIVGIVLDLLYMVYEPPPFKALGEVVTTGITLTILFRLLDVFPFDLPNADGWETSVRASLIFITVCVMIAMIVQIVKLFHALLGARK